MYIDKMKVHDFRAFQKPFELKLGRYITAISGLNGIGKSTLLAILTNSSELKVKDGRLLNGEQFKGDFSDVIMYDSKNDTVGPKATVYFKELPSNTNDSIYTNVLDFRASKHSYTRKNVHFKLISGTTQYEKTETPEKNIRYRLIPEKTEDRPSEKKINWPSYYLGLSRLYPVGETERAKKSSISSDIKKELLEKHIDILSERIPGDPADSELQNLSIPNVSKSKFGIETNAYGSTSNSSGQDNLGQILLTLKSFELLKDNLGINYHGGILAIDELDASLHPAAQNRLFDWLFLRAKQLNIQIVFTTHSISLLEHISDKIDQHGVAQNDIKISYLSTELDMPGQVFEHENPDPDYFRHNLTKTYQTQLQFNRPVNAILEDDVARHFFKLIIEHSKFSDLNEVVLPEVSISWNHLLNLIEAVPTNFRNTLIVLDPDVNPKNNDSLKKQLEKNYLSIIPNDPNGTLFTLPGTKEIEEMLLDYLLSLNSNADFYHDPFILNCGYDMDAALKSYEKVKGQKNAYKHWFTDNSHYIDALMKFWIIDNSNEVDEFCKTIHQAFCRCKANLQN